MPEIWIADWTFYTKDEVYFKNNERHVKPGLRFTLKSMVTKKVPLHIHLAKKEAYSRAMRDLELRVGVNFIKTLEVDKKTGLKKFTIEYIKKVGY